MANLNVKIKRKTIGQTGGPSNLPYGELATDGDNLYVGSQTGGVPAEVQSSIEKVPTDFGGFSNAEEWVSSSNVKVGHIVYDNGAFYVKDNAGNVIKASGALDGSPVQIIEQNAHGLAIGNVIRLSGADYIKSQADSVANAEVIGIVTEVISVNKFKFTLGGPVAGLTSLTAGDVYFLSPDTAGAITSTKPSDAGEIIKPVLVATSTTAGYFINFNGVEVTDGIATFYQDFIDADLTSGVLTLNHGFGHKYVMIQIYDNNDDGILPDNINLVDANTSDVDLTSFGTLTGTWRAVAFDQGANVANHHSYSNSFDDSELQAVTDPDTGAGKSAGEIHINHSFTNQFVNVIVYDDNDQIITPDDITATTDILTTVDLTSFGTITGTWQAIAFDQGTNARYPTVLSSGAQSPALKNLFINSNMQIAQNGVSFNPVADGDYTLDGFIWNDSGNLDEGDFTISQDSESPTNSNYSLKTTVTTAETAIAADEYAGITQAIEGNNFYPIRGDKAILSFWVNSSVTGTYCVAFRNTGLDRSYIVEYVINNIDTWEKKSVELDFKATGGTWNYTTGVGIYVTWVLGAGADYQNTADSWLATNDLATSNQTQFVETLNATFHLSQINLNQGSDGLEHQPKTYQEDLHDCYRYKYIIGQAEPVGSGVCDSTTEAHIHVHFPIDMRILPTATLGTSGDIGLHVGGGRVTTTTTATLLADFQSEKSAIVVVTATGLTAGGAVVASMDNSAGAKLTFDATL